MAYQLPDGTVIVRPRRGRSFVIDGVRHPEMNLQRPLFRAGNLIEEVPDPKPPEPTPEQIAQRELDRAQNQRLQTLKNAVIDQFDMILALWQVGRDKGIWTAQDFPAELRTKVQEWRTLINDYRANDVEQEPPA